MNEPYGSWEEWKERMHEEKGCIHYVDGTVAEQLEWVERHPLSQYQIENRRDITPRRVVEIEAQRNNE